MHVVVWPWPLFISRTLHLAELKLYTYETLAPQPLLPPSFLADIIQFSVSVNLAPLGPSCKWNDI